MVDFGKNIGYEFNNKHFAIVISNDDSDRSGTLLVLPLTSKKRAKRVSFDFSIIHSIIFKNFEDFLTLARIAELGMKQEAIVGYTFGDNDVYVPSNVPELNKYIARKNALLMIVENEDVKRWIHEDKLLIKEVNDYYVKYNKQSYGKLDSIREIDKSRIIPPINSFDPIGKVKIPDDMIARLKNSLRKKLGL